LTETQIGHGEEEGPTGAPPSPPEVELSPGDRRLAGRCLSLLGFLSGGSLVGVASSLYLVNNYPLLLIALSPIGRHLILVAPIVDPIAFIGVAITRRLVFYLGSFYLGRALGESGITWLGARSARAARFVVWLQQLFRRAPHVAVVLLPGPMMSTLAGMSGMRRSPFFILTTLGLFFRMVITVRVAEHLREPIEAVLAFVDEYWMEGTVVMVIVVLIYQWSQRRSGLAIGKDLLDK
jgi:membrane protein DedA with SNARE-associated domain